MELYTRQGPSCSILVICQKHWLNTEEDGAVGNEANEEQAHTGAGRWRELTGIPGTWQLMASASEHLFPSLHASYWNWSCVCFWSPILASKETAEKVQPSGVKVLKWGALEGTEAMAMICS